VCVGGQFVCFNFQPAMWDVMDGGIAGNDGGTVLFLIYFLKIVLVGKLELKGAQPQFVYISLPSILGFALRSGNCCVCVRWY